MVKSIIVIDCELPGWGTTSALSPTLFNIYIDDLDACVPEELEVSTHKYADEENAKKTKDMWICFGKSNPQPPTLYIVGNMIERVDTFKLLGVGCQSNMKWNSHIKEITRK